MDKRQNIFRRISATMYCVLLVLFCLAKSNQRNLDYWAEDFDENKNCVREKEMKELKKDPGPERCALGTTQGSARIQWEDCKEKLFKQLWLNCKPRNIEKVGVGGDVM